MQCNGTGGPVRCDVVDCPGHNNMPQCGSRQGNLTCSRYIGHIGNHVDHGLGTSWNPIVSPPAPVPSIYAATMPPQPGGNAVSRTMCGVLFPENFRTPFEQYVVCGLEFQHHGPHRRSEAEAVAVTGSILPTPNIPGVMSGMQRTEDMMVHDELVPGGANRAPVAADYSQLSHVALHLMAETQAEGNKRYGVGNWQKGIPLSNLLSHAMEHLMKLQNGDTSDGTTLRQHFGHALWNIEKAAHFFDTRPDLIDIEPLRKAASSGEPKA